MTTAKVLSLIHSAFPKRELSEAEVTAWRLYVDLFAEMAASEEAEAFEVYGMRRWDMIPDGLISASFLSVHSLPHEAFTYYLPRIMVSAVEHPFELSMERIVARLIDPSYAVNSISRAQADALLALCELYAGNDFFGDSYVAENLAVLEQRLAGC